jgi:hypothetical protein
MIEPVGAQPGLPEDGSEPAAAPAKMRFQSIAPQRDINDLIQNLGCGHAFRGGSCDTGDFVENCVYANEKAPNADKCKGDNQLMQIPAHYACADQRNLFKCVKVKYNSKPECQLSCVGECHGSECKKASKKSKKIKRRFF